MGDSLHYYVCYIHIQRQMDRQTDTHTCILYIFLLFSSYLLSPTLMLEIESRALHMLGKHRVTVLQGQPFVYVLFRDRHPLTNPGWPSPHSTVQACFEFEESPALACHIAGITGLVRPGLFSFYTSYFILMSDR